MLDLVFSSIECMIGNVNVSEPFSSSHHNIITFDMLYDSQITTWEEYSFDYRRGNYDEMDKSLLSVDWDALFYDNNVSEKWAIFKEVLDDAASKLVPRRKRRTGQKQLWWRRGISKTTKLKRKMWNIYIDTKNIYAYDNYMMALSNATKAMRRAKRSLKKNAHTVKNDPNAFYCYARKKMKTKDSVDPLISDNGDGPCVASMLSMFFASVFSSEDTNILPLIVTSTYLDMEVLSHIDLSSCTTYKNLKNLRLEKSPCVDNFYQIVLCNLASVLSIPLRSIYQRSIECNVMPVD